MTKHALLLAAGLSGLLFYPTVHADVKFTGFVEGELRLYPSDGLLREQKQVMPSAAFEPQLSWRSDDRSHGVKVKAFGRYSDPDGHRDHVDLREAYYSFAGQGWQIQAGVNKVFWGVTESQHLVDIINQTDNLESVNGEEKLGQPMLAFGLEQSWGNLDLYILPYFRERKFPNGPERFRLAMPGDVGYFNQKDVFYESDREEKHVDFAARWGAYYDNLDVGISAFSGTSRDPLPVLSSVSVAFVPTFSVWYEQMHQIGIELQYIYEGWAFKYESASRWQESGNYHAVTAGFEYTISGIAGSDVDLGLLSEYLWNNRDDIYIKKQSLKVMGLTEATADPIIVGLLNTTPLPAKFLSPFENDIFFGARVALNDINSTDFLAGVIVDLDTQTTTASFEGSTRIGNSVRISLNIYLFEHVSENSAFTAFRRDDQIEAKVAWYF